MAEIKFLNEDCLDETQYSGEGENATASPIIESSNVEVYADSINSENLNEEVSADKDNEPKTILREEVFKREENVKHYLMSDGTYEAHYFSEPIHVYDEAESRYVDINNALCACSECLEDEDDFDGYVTQKGLARVKVAKDTSCKNLFSVSRGEHKLTFKLLGKKHAGKTCSCNHTTPNIDNHCSCCAENETVSTQKSDVLYSEIFPSCDLHYSINTNSLKENIIVKDRQESYEYEFALKTKGLNAELSENKQTINFYVNKMKDSADSYEKETIFTIPMPCMFDAAGEASNDITYELKKKDNGYIFKITANPEWINAENRNFPVTIDPVIIFKNKSNISTKHIYLDEDYYTPNSPECVVGYNASNGKRVRSYFQVNNTLGSSRIIGACVNLYQTDLYYEGGNISNFYFEIRKITQSWDLEKVSRSNLPQVSNNAYGVFVMDVSKTHDKNAFFPYKEPISIDVTKMLNEGLFHGFMIKCLNETSTGETGYVSFCTENTNRQLGPQLVVAYVDDFSVKSNKQLNSSVKRAGEGQLDLFTKNLCFVHSDVSLGGEKMPLNISHIYNSNASFSKGINSSVSEHVRDIGCGYGWRTNYHQYMFLLPQRTEDSFNVHGKNNYVYIDGYGKTTLITSKKLRNGFFELTDDSGNLSYDENSRILKDKNENKLCFNSSGKLTRIQDAFGVSTLITYSGNFISSVTDGGGRKAIFNYEIQSSSNLSLLSNISYDNGNKKILFEYTPKSELKKIIYPEESINKGQDCSEYYYDESFGSGSHRLTSICDCSGYKISYSYGIDNLFTIKESTRTEKINNNGITYATIEKEGNMISVKYTGMQTLVSYPNGQNVIHKFHSNGMAYCSYECNAKGYGSIENINFSYATKKENLTISTIPGSTNIMMNGGFESGTAMWDGVPTTARTTENAVFGYYCAKINAGLSGNNCFSYTVTGIPSHFNCFVISGFAKANSVNLNELSKFRISAQIFYYGSYSEKKVYADFNYMETGWQLAAVGVSKSSYYKDKTIEKIVVSFEYSKNYGPVYFDNFSLRGGVCVTQELETKYFVQYNNSEPMPIENVSSIRFRTNEGFFNTEIVKEISNTDNSKNFITKDDVNIMNNQTIVNNKACVILNGDMKSDCAIYKDGKTIELKINGYYYDIFQCVIRSTNVIKVNDGNMVTTTYETDFKGNIVQTTVTDEFGQSFVTNHANTFGRPVVELDNGRNIKNHTSYDSYGNILQKSKYSTLERGEENHLKLLMTYENNGNTISKMTDERGMDYATTFNYNNNNGLVNSIILPNGNSTNYSYYNSQAVKTITTTVDTDTMHNTFEYNKGLLTKISANKSSNGSSNNSASFEYDGFGVPVKIDYCGQTVIEKEYMDKYNYSAYDETKFNYSQNLYNINGIKKYAEKEIFNKEGNIVCKKGITYNNNVNSSEQDIFRATYSNVGISKVEDYGISYGKNNPTLSTDKLIYNNVLKADGSLDYVDISGYYSGKLKESRDERKRLKTKTIEFGDTNTYSFEYEKKGISVHPDERLSKIVFPVQNGSSNYTYDNLGRIKSKKISTMGSSQYIQETYNYLKQLKNDITCEEGRMTNFIESVSYTGNAMSGNISYTYDKIGNIKTISEVGKDCSYIYDGLGRLTRENNKGLNFTKLYAYDSLGNRKSVKKYSYTSETLGALQETITYTYSSGTDNCQLIGTSNGFTINGYDFQGNPCNFKNNVLEWERSKLLKKYGSNTYKYNASGIRQEKTVNGVTTKYFLEGTTIHKEMRGTTPIWYTYDASGIAGINYNGTQYYYKKNIQGDIIGIVKMDGGLIATYVYDAWGNHKVCNADGSENTSSNFIGNQNPFRYRGYYYDTETKLYYLQTRYYDPELGRFINADSIDYLNPEAIGGLNLYSYCGNNPVNLSDSTGCSPFWDNFWKVLGGIAIIGALVVGTIFTGGALSVVLAGAAIGAISGAIGSTLSTAISGDWANFGNNFLMGTVVGGISGAIAASPLGLGWQIGLNAALGIANYATTTAINGGNITLGGLLFSGATGALAGLVGGAGFMKGNNMATAVAAFGARNFFKVMGQNFWKAGLDIVARNSINAFVVGGALNGGYAKLSSWLNPKGKFIGW